MKEKCKSKNKDSLKLIIQSIIPNITIQYIDEQEMIVSSSYTLYKKNRNKFDEIITLKVPLVSRLFGKLRLTTRAFRLGIRTIIKLKNGILLIVADKKIFRLKDSKASIVFSFKKGFGPLRNGWCIDEKGNCYLGEYFLNNKRKEVVNLYKSSDNGEKWVVIYTLNDVRHIHCVQYDPFDKLIWVSTGDKNEESKILVSNDEGISWVTIGSGDQKFRNVSFLFTENHVYWGSDAPAKQNYIYRYRRKDGEIKPLAKVGGPVYYSAILKKEGIKLFATTAEGSSEKKSNKGNRSACIWASRDGVHWKVLASWQKDVWPYILGYGKILFARGCYDDDLYFTLQCLKGGDGVSIQAKVL